MVYGSRLFGKVDVVPGMFWVATKCGHLNFFPLFPMQTYIVVSQQGTTWNGLPVGLSGKSFLVAWLRACCWLGMIIGGIMGLISLAPSIPETAFPTASPKSL